ncbi:M23 family metallopeptidase [Streptomyces sp. NBC_01445]|uniref:M23 family metallopeptidase n=1 Tax=Streptomyces sp. NBC_01445 TaxID=2903869 RepID=UPI002DD9585C|nr:M23 family metallopeptidase [Streptomyces sp. NBC_01445]WSE03759.1 M23 family metallopeptidase [Streptomyces sp. NBC_01445]
MSQAIKKDLGNRVPCDQVFLPKEIAHITADLNATAEAQLDLVPFAHLKIFFTNDGQGLAPHPPCSARAGQRVAEVGSTGNATGPHLDFEKRPAGGRFGSDVTPSWS